ncbi:IclR family transcriptional regulator [Afipia carboxidovorans]|uniref:IclR family transcriptional regulator n=1 Tax=Afipia carboxidovorans TaxID=40137 RepID=UPI003090E769|nr:IclR family transcriptional regulator [Afipia carboxidovorans]
MLKKLDQRDRDKGQSFLRAFKLMEAIARSSAPLSATELSDLTGTSRPSVVRLCQTLQEEGLVARAIDGKSYTYGARLCRLGMDIMAGGAMMAERSLLLRQATENIGETCNIVVHDHGTMVIADRVESNWAVRAAFDVGTRVPLETSASGKLFLSSLPKASKSRILTAIAKSSGADKRKKLQKELDAIRAQGFSVDDQILQEGMAAVAVPIKDSRGRFCAALSAQGATFRFSVNGKDAEKHAAMLRPFADQFQKLIGAA